MIILFQLPRFILRFMHINRKLLWNIRVFFIIYRSPYVPFHRLVLLKHLKIILKNNFLIKVFIELRWKKLFSCASSGMNTVSFSLLLCSSFIILVDFKVLEEYTVRGIVLGGVHVFRSVLVDDLVNMFCWLQIKWHSIIIALNSNYSLFLINKFNFKI